MYVLYDLKETYTTARIKRLQHLWVQVGEKLKITCKWQQQQQQQKLTLFRCAFNLLLFFASN